MRFPFLVRPFRRFQDEVAITIEEESAGVAPPTHEPNPTTAASGSLRHVHRWTERVADRRLVLALYTILRGSRHAGVLPLWEHSKPVTPWR